jgi:hypothetical protein
MIAQQLVSSCQASAQARTTTNGASRSGLARLADKRIAAFGGSNKASAFTGVS